MDVILKKLPIFLGLCLLALFMQSAVAKVTVFAAASMTNVLQEIEAEYKKENSSNVVVFSFASSSTLAKQIEQGAPADMFVSADLKWMQYLADKKRIEEKTQGILAGNQLVMIAPKNSDVEMIELSNPEWHKILDSDYLAMGDPNHVPAGIYGKQALSYLGQWETLQTRVAAANNVRAALSLVEMGESPLGIVYATDAKASKKVQVVGVFPEQSHSPVEYPVAFVKDRENIETQAFFNYLKSDKAKKILSDHGFVVK